MELQESGLFQTPKKSRVESSVKDRLKTQCNLTGFKEYVSISAVYVNK